MNDLDYAIAVGISFYPEEWDPLMAAPIDATRFMDWVLDSEGGDVCPENTRLILTTAGRQSNAVLDTKPDQDDIDQALIDFGVHPDWDKRWKGKFLGRRLYFYFSGHGFGPESNDVGMLMADAAPDRLQKSMSVRHYRQFFAERPLFEEVVFIVDCCRDPLPKGHIMVEASKPSINLNKEAPSDTFAEFVLLGTSNGKKSYEAPDPVTEEPGGVLTRLVLKALRDRTAVDEGGERTAEAIRSYMKVHLDELTVRVGRRSIPQNPQFQGNVIEAVRPPKLTLGKVAPLASAPVRIIAPAKFAGELIVLEEGTTEIARESTEKATKTKPWIVNLSRSKRYSVQYVSPTESKVAFIDWAEVEVNGNDFVFPGNDPDA